MNPSIVRIYGKIILSLPPGDELLHIYIKKLLTTLSGPYGNLACTYLVQLSKEHLENIPDITLWALKNEDSRILFFVSELMNFAPEELLENNLFDILPVLVRTKDKVSLKRLCDLLKQDERNVTHL